MMSWSVRMAFTGGLSWSVGRLQGGRLEHKCHGRGKNQIFVVSDDGIAESGTHDELLTMGGKYVAMWDAEQKLSARGK